MESIYYFPIISIDFVPAFPWAALDVYVFIDITLEMGVDRNRI